MDGKQQFKLEAKINRELPEIEPEIVFFIDKFCKATGHYPQLLTGFAIIYITKEILKSENRDNILGHALEESAYDFDAFKYLKSYTEKIYNAHGAVMPDSFNINSDKNNFRKNILMSPLNFRIEKVKDLVYLINILKRKGKVTEDRVSDILVEIDEEIKHLSQDIKEYVSIERERTKKPDNAELAENPELKKHYQELDRKASEIANKTKEKLFESIYNKIPEVKDKTIYSLLIKIFKENFVERLYALTETRNNLDELANVRTRTTMSNLCKSGDDEACILLKKWLEKEGVPELTYKETPELLAVLKRRGFEIKD